MPIKTHLNYALNLGGTHGPISGKAENEEESKKETKKESGHGMISC